MKVKQNHTITDLNTIFSSVKEVYFVNKEMTTTDLAKPSIEADYEFPVLEDGVSFDTGAPDITQIKLTTGKIWTQKTKRGDSDISINVATIDDGVNKLLLNDSNALSNVNAPNFETDETYEGQGFNLDPKVVTGALIFYSEDRSTIIVLPNAYIVSSLNAADSDNPAYFKLVVTPRANTEGDEIFILKKKVKE